jgi:geranylgeranyl pyrophosphate synthase
MDNDDMRRGKPSCHVKFGEANALLAGDALLTAAFGLAAESTASSAESKLNAISVLSRRAGIDGMIGGQVVDLIYEEKTADESVLKLICSLKTGALIKAACSIGCVLAGADKKKVKAAEDYADYLGLAFQIVDDILDETSTAEKLGKPIHSDKENNKSTFVSLFGIDKCKKLVEELTNMAKTSLQPFGPEADELKTLADYLCNRDY